MKKKVLAMLLGGVMAVGTLSLQMPATVCAMTRDECNFYSDKHIKSYEVTTADGLLAVTIDFEVEAASAYCFLYAFEKQLVESDEYGLIPDDAIREWEAEGRREEAQLVAKGSGTYTFTGLTGGKTYYVYCEVIDLHDMELGEDSAEHSLAYLAPGTPNANSGSSSSGPITLDKCGWHTEAHVASSEVTTVDGQLAVNIVVNEFEGDVTEEQAGFTLVALEKQLGNPTTWNKVGDELIDLGWPEESCLFANRESGTYTFAGLSAGKTYYVYCVAFDHVWGPEACDDHDVMCLGSGTPTVGPANTPAENTPSGSGSSGSTPSEGTPSESAPSSGSNSVNVSREDQTAVQIRLAEPGSTVVMEKGITTLSNSIMKELSAKGDVSLKLEFIYQGEEYVIVIPAGAAIDNDIPWYGPLYLAQQYGNRAGAGASEAGGTYEVKSGDSMSRIAAANNMTLKQLLAKNPQIKDPNKIAVKQKINL